MSKEINKGYGFLSVIFGVIGLLTCVIHLYNCVLEEEIAIIDTGILTHGLLSILISIVETIGSAIVPNRTLKTHSSNNRGYTKTSNPNVMYKEFSGKF